jgi:hypothetical protein
MEETKAKKGGRPPKADQEKKTCRIEMKLTQADFDQLEKQYQNSGYRNRSEMYHDMVFHKTLRQKESGTLEMLKELQDYAREIKAIGAGYQQAVQAVQVLPDAGKVAAQLQELIDLTTGLQEKEREVFQIILKLREKWLREL